jgi:AraC family transcriptional regulator of adaptative response/methylated-DNA-[protein]-cysteine methyltransferase
MSQSDYARVETAIRYLEAHAEEQPDLATLAARAGLSEFHFQRLFKRWAGVSPKDFLQSLTLARAKALLAGASSLLEASHALGLSGPSRLHDLFLTLEAMTPGEFKRGGEGLELHWGVHATPFGEALFAGSDRGLCGLSFLGDDADALAELRSRWPEAHLREDPRRTRAAAEAVAERMRGGSRQPIALLLKGSPFQLKVWKALLAVPEGRLVSYQAVAELAGTPGAARAVGSAVAANPIAYLIPCHRVIRATGAAGDYHWGRLRKRILLGVEGARAAGPARAS